MLAAFSMASGCSSTKYIHVELDFSALCASSNTSVSGCASHVNEFVLMPLALILVGHSSSCKPLLIKNVLGSSMASS